MALNFSPTEYIAGTDPGAGSVLDFASGDVIGISVWWLSTNNNNKQTLLSKGSAAGGNDWNFLLRTNTAVAVNSRFEFGYRSADDASFQSWWPTNSIAADGNWRHGAYTYEYADGSTILCYVDGSNEAGSWDTGDDGNDAPTQNATDVQVGAADGASGFNGSIGLLMLYKNPGVDASVLSAFRFTPFRFTNGLSYAIMPYSTSAVPDLSGNGISNTINGTPTVADHCPTGPPFGFSKLIPYAAAGVAGPLVNVPTRLTTLVGGGLV
jgi:hypothetical protein